MRFHGKGIYQYNASTRTTTILLEGKEKYENIKIENNTVYYNDGKKIK